ncbi:hypothetical protein BB561_000782 [Smittium simulii]|uniref:Protein LTV1 n=1 Tax=Smittium simulii TaxID=133385 RepID=A0A2T9YXK2_9FUNG|nr:hypothetical protein BB561_000782 [Smittium simulii]
MGKSKFVDKKVAKTYKLVYRSQQDPLTYEKDAGPGILAQVLPSNLKKKKNKTLQLDDNALENAENSAFYGIYTEDLDYDYLQHLKPLNTGESGDVSVLLEAKKPTASKQDSDKLFGMDLIPKKKVKFELPEEVAKQTTHLMDINREAVPSGLELDMDPDVREALDALEHADDYESVSDIDALMDAINESDAEYASGDDYDEQGIGNDDDLFKMIQKSRYSKKSQDSDDELSYDSDDFGETNSKKSSHFRSVAKSNFTMTSSIMHRNENLTLLDDQFDQLEQEYAQMDSSDSENDKNYKSTRPDFEKVIDKYYNASMPEPVGGTVTLDSIRKELNSISSKSSNVASSSKNTTLSKASTPLFEDLELTDSPRRPLWDAESIISSYSNLDNHPIMVRQYNATPKIRLTKSGFPLDYVNNKNQEISAIKNQTEKREKDPVIFVRNKDESRPEKNLRKLAARQLKKERKIEKKDRALEFEIKKNRSLQSKNDKKQLSIHID